MAEERIRDQNSHGSTVAGPSGSLPSASISGQGTRNRLGGRLPSYAPSEVSTQDDFGRDVHARPPSPTATEASADVTVSKYSGTSYRGNFAKLAAYQAPIHTKVQNQMEREARQKQQQMAAKRQESDDDGSDWEL